MEHIYRSHVKISLKILRAVQSARRLSESLAHSSCARNIVYFIVYSILSPTTFAQDVIAPPPRPCSKASITTPVLLDATRPGVFIADGAGYRLSHLDIARAAPLEKALRPPLLLIPTRRTADHQGLCPVDAWHFKNWVQEELLKQGWARLSDLPSPHRRRDQLETAERSGLDKNAWKKGVFQVLTPDTAAPFLNNVIVLEGKVTAVETLGLKTFLITLTGNTHTVKVLVRRRRGNNDDPLPSVGSRLETRGYLYWNDGLRLSVREEAVVVKPLLPPPALPNPATSPITPP